MKKQTKRPAKRDKTELFVKVMLETLDTPAWRALSHGARSLYVALKRRCRNDLRNNGNVFLSQRQAELELGSKRRYVAGWFRELEHYGFIMMTRPGSLGIEGRGKAPHWRLTELGYRDDPPTRDFLNWNGVRFCRAPKHERAAACAAAEAKRTEALVTAMQQSAVFRVRR